MTPDIGARAYYKKLGDQIACYEEIILISKEQYELVADGAYADLAGAVRRRDKLLERLDILQYVITAYGNFWVKVVDSVDNELNEKISLTLEKLQSVLHELQIYDKQLKATSIKELARIRKELTIIKHNKTKAAAYNRPIFKPVPCYVNKVINI